MRIRFVATAILALASAAIAQDDLFKPMKGSATPEFQMAEGDGRCLVFGTHIVKTKTSPDGGENVSVWNREGTAKGTAACRTGSKPYFTIADSDNNSFYGISAVYFFIDQGTSSGSRTLAVYKTDSGDEVKNVGYYGSGNEPRIEAARYLYYDDYSNKKGPASACPSAAKWRRNGGGVAWLQGKKLDLNTLTTTNTGPLHCAPEE